MANELQRLGIGRLVESLGPRFRVRTEPDLPRALRSAVADASSVLIVALPDVLVDAGRAVSAATAAGAKVLILFEGDDPRRLTELSQARSCGYLDVGELDAAAVGEALLRTRRGEIVIPPALAASLLAAVREPPPAAHPVRMTPRERQVLHLLVGGLSNKQIARQLEISEHGAKRIVANIMAKMDCPTRTLVVSKAIRIGMLHAPGTEA